MSKPTRYAAQQWEMGGLTPSARQLALQIQSLRARIEALEAAQLEQAESHRFCTDAIVRRVEALELAHRIQSGTLTSAERAELGVVTRVQLDAAMLRSTSDARQAAMYELRAASAEARPAGGLVERVAARIEYGIDAELDPEGIARATIREVAAAARLRDLNGQSVAVMTWEMVAQWLEQEASRG